MPGQLAGRYLEFGVGKPGASDPRSPQRGPDLPVQLDGIVVDVDSDSLHAGRDSVHPAVLHFVHVGEVAADAGSDTEPVLLGAHVTQRELFAPAAVDYPAARVRNPRLRL